MDELDIKEVAEDRRLGVMTDRQENGAIALIQAWAEGSWVSSIAIMILVVYKLHYIVR